MVMGSKAKKSKMTDDFASMCYKASNMSSKTGVLKSAPPIPVKKALPPKNEEVLPAFGGMGLGMGAQPQQ